MNNLQNQAIAHYKKMIKWVKTQDPKALVLEEDMRLAITETWEGSYCAYCTRIDPTRPEGYSGCFKCPLHPFSLEPHPTAFYCCNVGWNRLAASDTWETWLIHAEEIVTYIKDHG